MMHIDDLLAIFVCIAYALLSAAVFGGGIAATYYSCQPSKLFSDTVANVQVCYCDGPFVLMLGILLLVAGLLFACCTQSPHTQEDDSAQAVQMSRVGPTVPAECNV